jgi:hypothetical protein
MMDVAGPRFRAVVVDVHRPAQMIPTDQADEVRGALGMAAGSTVVPMSTRL